MRKTEASKTLASPKASKGSKKAAARVLSSSKSPKAGKK